MEAKPYQGVVRKLVDKKQEALPSLMIRHKTTMENVFNEIINNGSRDFQSFFVVGEKPPKNKVVAVSGDNSADIYSSLTGLAKAILVAYSYHRKLVLRPDDIWTCIIQSLATHVNQYPEDYRGMFVNHNGKIELKVFIKKYDHFGTSSTEMWLPGVQDICDQITGNTRTDVVDSMTADFSTTDVPSMIVSKVVAMGAMSKYFDFVMTTRCGIPEVELLGTAEDWQKLTVKTMKMYRMFLAHKVSAEISTPLERWFGGIMGIVGNMNATYSGADRVEWWSHIIDAVTTYGSGGSTTYNGWFRSLYLYTGSKNLMPPGNERIDMSVIPSGVTEVPFIWDDNDIPIKMRLMAGHIGMRISEDGAVSPVIAWAVAKN